MGMQVEVDDSGYLTKDSVVFLQQRGDRAGVERWCHMNNTKFHEDDLVPPGGVHEPYVTTQANSGALGPTSQDSILKQEVSDESEEDVEDEADGEDEDDVLPYQDWSIAELRKELKDRKLSAGGGKEELVARLEESDEAAE